jgi:hypothetical protein
VDLALHRIDLIRAQTFLHEIGQQGGVQPGPKMSTVCMALWQAALVATMKCFQKSDSRAQKLDRAAIFQDQAVRDAFDTLMLLRNKHVVHDENDWMQALPYAVVTVRGHNPMVSEVDCVVIEGVDTAHIDMLRSVVDAVLAWLNKELDKLKEAIRDDLLTRDYDKLIALPAPTTKTPQSGSIGQRR